LSVEQIRHATDVALTQVACWCGAVRPRIHFREHEPESRRGDHAADAAAARRAATTLPDDFTDFLTTYAAELEKVPLSADTRRTYVSRVRMYLAWLAGGTGRRRFRGDPLTNPTVRDWAIRDYRLYLLREATPKRSIL
jgi:hypothetical protein